MPLFQVFIHTGKINGAIVLGFPVKWVMDKWESTVMRTLLERSTESHRELPFYKLKTNENNKMSLLLSQALKKSYYFQSKLTTIY